MFLKQVQNDTPRNEKFVILLNVIYRKLEKCLYAKIFDIYIFSSPFLERL